MGIFARIHSREQQEVPVVRHRFLASLNVIATASALAWFVSAAVTGQVQGPATKAWAASNGTPLRTAWGQPDLQGIWTTDNEIDVPVERPPEFGDRAFLTDKEVAERTQEIERRARDDKDERPAAPSAEPTGGGPEHWYEQPKAVSRRTSLVVDPPDGRIPALTPAGRMRLMQFSKERSTSLGPWNGPEDLSQQDRCITRGVPNTWFPSAYNNGFQIFQNPQYVIILYERLHETRIIPLDGRSHLGPGIRQLLGDSRGHWEGNSLVVDVSNFSERAEFLGSKDALHVVERYTRIDTDTIRVEFTVDDPTTWVKPWTAVVTGKKDSNYSHIFEYACHEGNYSMSNMLSASRAEERAAVDAVKRTKR
jgi:hypothetical protein